MIKYLISLTILIFAAIFCDTAIAAATPATTTSAAAPSPLAVLTNALAAATNAQQPQQADMPKYTAQIAVANENIPERDKAIITALQQVLVKISGKPDIINSKKIKKALMKASTIVQSYSYVTNIDNNKQPALFLQVNFYPDSINKILDQTPASIAPLDTNTNNENHVNDAENAAKKTSASQNNDNSVTPDAIDDTPEMVNLRISNITKLEQHDIVINYIKTLDKSIVSVQLTDVNRDFIALQLKVIGGQDALIKAIKNKGSKLSPIDTGFDVEDETMAIDYRWNE